MFELVHVTTNCPLTVAVAYPLSTVDEGASLAFRAQAKGLVQEELGSGGSLCEKI